MVSIMPMLVLSIKIFSFLILFQSTTSSTSDVSGLLSHLYKKAVASSRPLILIIDIDAPHPIGEAGNTFIQMKHKGNSIESNKRWHSSSLYNKKNKKSKIERLPLIRNGKILERQFEALLPQQNRIVNKVKTPPIIKSLLRISNNLRCQARDECEDECDEKYDGNKQDKCRDKCETKFECEKEKEDPCEDDDCEESNECGGSICQGSTKGWLLSNEKPRCPEC